MGLILAGRYRLESNLGGGGMGTVFLGYDLQMGRPVAIKVLSTSLAAEREVVEQFLGEGRTMAALNDSNPHPNVVSVFDCGLIPANTLLRVTASRAAAFEPPTPEESSIQRTRPQPYLVMERLDGLTLAQRLAALKGEKLELELVLEIVEQILVALEVPHQNHIIHRDIKPSNVFLIQESDPLGNMYDKRDRSGRLQVKLLDFGIAVATQKNEAIPEIAGTPEYMSPEQISGNIGPPSDLYSVGAVMYEMLSGAPPFISPRPASSRDERIAMAMDIVRRHKTEAPKPLAAIPGATQPGPAVVRFLDRLLAKNPMQRFQSAGEAITDLHIARQDSYDSLAGAETLYLPSVRPSATSRLARPPGWGNPVVTAPTTRGLGRKKRKWALLLLLLLLLLGGGLATTKLLGYWPDFLWPWQTRTPTIELTTTTPPPVAPQAQPPAEALPPSPAQQQPSAAQQPPTAAPVVRAPVEVPRTPTRKATRVRSSAGELNGSGECVVDAKVRDYVAETRLKLEGYVPQGDSAFASTSRALDAALNREDCRQIFVQLNKLRRIAESGAVKAR